MNGLAKLTPHSIATAGNNRLKEGRSALEYAYDAVG